MKLEIYPKPDKFNINGNFYAKEMLDEKINDFNNKIKNSSVGVHYVELGYDNDTIKIPQTNIVGEISEVYKDNDVYYADFKLLDTQYAKTLKALHDNGLFNSTDYVLAAASTGTVKENKIILDEIIKFVIISRNEVER